MNWDTFIENGGVSEEDGDAAVDALTDSISKLTNEYSDELESLIDTFQELLNSTEWEEIEQPNQYAGYFTCGDVNVIILLLLFLVKF